MRRSTSCSGSAAPPRPRAASRFVVGRASRGGRPAVGLAHHPLAASGRRADVRRCRGSGRAFSGRLFRGRGRLPVPLARGRLPAVLSHAARSSHRAVLPVVPAASSLREPSLRPRRPLGASGPTRTCVWLSRCSSLTESPGVGFTRTVLRGTADPRSLSSRRSRVGRRRADSAMRTLGTPSADVLDPPARHVSGRQLARAVRTIQASNPSPRRPESPRSRAAPADRPAGRSGRAGTSRRSRRRSPSSPSAGPQVRPGIQYQPKAAE